MKSHIASPDHLQHVGIEGAHFGIQPYALDPLSLSQRQRPLGAPKGCQVQLVLEIVLFGIMDRQSTKGIVGIPPVQRKTRPWLHRSQQALPKKSPAAYNRHGMHPHRAAPKGVGQHPVVEGSTVTRCKFITKSY